MSDTLDAFLSDQLASKQTLLDAASVEMANLTQQRDWQLDVLSNNFKVRVDSLQIKIDQLQADINSIADYISVAKESGVDLSSVGKVAPVVGPVVPEPPIISPVQEVSL